MGLTLTLLRTLAAKFWPWILGLVVIGLLILGVKLAYNQYEEMVAKVATSNSTASNVLSINAGLNAELVKQVQDTVEKQTVSADIDTSQAANGRNVEDLRSQLDILIGQRDAAQKLLDAKTDPKCAATPTLPDSDSELTIAWKAYCEVMPAAKECLEKVK